VWEKGIWEGHELNCGPSVGLSVHPVWGKKKQTLFVKNLSNEGYEVSERTISPGGGVFLVSRPEEHKKVLAGVKKPPLGGEHVGRVHKELSFDPKKPKRVLSFYNPKRRGIETFR